MINRALLRIKIIQIIYSYYKSEGNSIPAAVKELFHSIEKTYQLYFHLLQLSIDITHYASLKIDAKRNKLRPTEEDLHPNTRFIDNTFVSQLAQNKQLIQQLKEDKISWEHSNVIKELYEIILEADFYKEYMESPSVEYLADKEIWRKIFKKIILTNETLYNSIEDQSIYWTDDLEIIISFVIKTIKRFEFANGANQELMPMFKDEEDEEFISKLLIATLSNSLTYREMIDAHTKNWDIDRIAFMDIIIMQTALAEIMSFPTIPVSVTLNEYIEISKLYSTDKSAVFINGVLDNIVKELKSQKKLVKVVKV